MIESNREAQTQRVRAKYCQGRVELSGPVTWPEGTPLEVTPLLSGSPRGSWLALAPLDVGQFREPTPDDDLLTEMLDDSRD